MRRIAILLAVSACSEPPKEAFVVDGFVDVAISPNASVIGLWELRGTPARYYKQGDGVRLNRAFTLGFDTDPPPEALNSDGIGVAMVAMLPELTTVPDGFVDSATLGILGLSANTAVIYKAFDATGPAWASNFGPRFSCAQCVRSQTALDTYELIACASVIVEGPADPLCKWF